MVEGELRAAVVGLGKMGLLQASLLNAMPGVQRASEPISWRSARLFQMPSLRSVWTDSSLFKRFAKGP